ncbi:hypothetical protein Pme01_36940 [Planosporangium mesophilum]|uniref:Secreted protein n=2 Tax=Planosporangium mesophilum TaxID=689768 RepID=A0A8J3X182_9ACTN|nr:hypothetical protein Pme01_36940 [Planosporangium mesophilum]
MTHTSKKVMAGLALGAAFLLGGASAAYAGGSLNLRTSNANEGSFSGSWTFYPAGTGHGGFVVNGNICDNANDGNGVYGQGRAAGYDWAARRGDSNGSSAGCAYENREFYDPQATQVGSGQYQVCVDDLGPDTCGVSQVYYR